MHKLRTITMLGALFAGVGLGTTTSARAQPSQVETAYTSVQQAAAMACNCPPGKCCKVVWIFSYCGSC